MGNIVSPAQQSKVSKLKGIIALLTAQQRKIRNARTKEYTCLKRLSNRMQCLTRKYNTSSSNGDRFEMVEDDMLQVDGYVYLVCVLRVLSQDWGYLLFVSAVDGSHSSIHFVRCISVCVSVRPASMSVRDCISLMFTMYDCSV